MKLLEQEERGHQFLRTFVLEDIGGHLVSSLGKANDLPTQIGLYRVKFSVCKRDARFGCLMKRTINKT